MLELFELLRDNAGILGGLLSFLGTVATLWWRIARTYTQTTDRLNLVYKQIGALASANLELTKSVVALSTKIDEREKDILKLEGIVELQRRDYMEATRLLNAVSASQLSIWDTLVAHKLAPERPSTKRGASGG